MTVLESIGKGERASSPEGTRHFHSSSTHSSDEQCLLFCGEPFVGDESPSDARRGGDTSEDTFTSVCKARLSRGDTATSASGVAASGLALLLCVGRPALRPSIFIRPHHDAVNPSINASALRGYSSDSNGFLPFYCEDADTVAQSACSTAVTGLACCSQLIASRGNRRPDFPSLTGALAVCAIFLARSPPPPFERRSDVWGTSDGGVVRQ